MDGVPHAGTRRGRARCSERRVEDLRSSEFSRAIQGHRTHGIGPSRGPGRSWDTFPFRSQKAGSGHLPRGDVKNLETEKDLGLF